MSVQMAPEQTTTDEELLTVQTFFERKRPELVRELDLLKTHFPGIYQQSASFFCGLAKKGRATWSPPISWPEDLRVQGILAKYPSCDFYGAGSYYNLHLAWARIKMVRRIFNAGKHLDPEMHGTALENWLYYCKHIEQSPLAAPISPENPLLQCLVKLIEEHIAS